MKFLAPFILVFLLLLQGCFALANIEALLGLDASSYPLPAGELSGEFGYDLPLWQVNGALKDPDGYLYGYLHPFIGGATAGDYQALTAAFEVFPISFFSFQAGTSWQKNSLRYTGFDCANFQCEGKVSNFFLESALEFEIDRLSGDVRFHRDNWRPSVTSHSATIDPTSALLLSNRERQNKVSSDLLWQLFPKWQTFISGNYIQGIDTRGFSRSAGAGAIYTFGRYAITAGAGVFKSQLKATAAVAFLQFSWCIKPGLGHKDLMADDTQSESKLPPPKP